MKIFLKNVILSITITWYYGCYVEQKFITILLRQSNPHQPNNLIDFVKNLASYQFKKKKIWLLIVGWRERSMKKNQWRRRGSIKFGRNKAVYILRVWIVLRLCYKSDSFRPIKSFWKRINKCTSWAISKWLRSKPKKQTQLMSKIWTIKIETSLVQINEA